MRKLICAFALLFVTTTNAATLKIQGQVNAYEGLEKNRPQLGLALHQKLLKNFGLNMWAGTGIEPFDTIDDVRWTAAKASIDTYYKNLTVGLGYQIKDVTGEGDTRQYGFFRLEYKIF